MTQRLQAFAALAALALVAALSAWWLYGIHRAADEFGDTRGPAWYFDGARLAATGRDGAVLYRVAAPRITHDPDDDSAVMTTPRLEWLQGDAPPLLITAGAGRAHSGRRQVALTDGVVIIDESVGNRFEFHTDHLEVDADRRLALTDAAIVVLSEHGELRGTGLVADLNAGTIRIESAVRGRYAR